MSALARKAHSVEFEQVTLDAPEPVRPALQIVRARQAPKRHGLTFRWQIDPVDRRLVQVWERVCAEQLQD
jgi:hypothetical protein